MCVPAMSGKSPNGDAENAPVSRRSAQNLHHAGANSPEPRNRVTRNRWVKRYSILRILVLAVVTHERTAHTQVP